MIVCQSSDRHANWQRKLTAQPTTNGSKPLAAALLDTMRRLGFGTITVDQYGYVTDINAIGRDLLESHIGSNRALPDSEQLRDSVRRLLDKATAGLPPEREGWVTISSERDRPLALHLIPLNPNAELSGSIVMILVDLDRPLQLNHTTLSNLFGLTAAEARLANQIARGTTTMGMAKHNCLSVATIRSQLASIFQKTNTRRQSELALLLSRAAVLP